MDELNIEQNLFYLEFMKGGVKKDARLDKITIHERSAILNFKY
jgi:hypothetical protein